MVICGTRLWARRDSFAWPCADQLSFIPDLCSLLALGACGCQLQAAVLGRFSEATVQLVQGRKLSKHLAAQPGSTKTLANLGRLWLQRWVISAVTGLAKFPKICKRHASLPTAL